MQFCAGSYLSAQSITCLSNLERDVAICIPYSKSKSPETYNFLNGHAKQALTESINDLFRINMWSDLGDLNDMSCKKMSAFRSWCEQQGIDIEYAETIRMKWYRMRKAYQEKGINRNYSAPL